MEKLFDLKIKSPSAFIDLKGVPEENARKCAESIMDSTNDKKLKEMIQGALSSFGFSGNSHGEYEVSTSLYFPREKTGEMMTCGRRMTEFGPWKRNENLDEWIKVGEDRVCSFCGSLHPRDVINIIKEHGPQQIKPTTKGYKMYVSRPGVANASLGGIKYYRQHDDENFVKDFNQLVFGKTTG